MSRTPIKYQLIIYGSTTGDYSEEYIIIASKPACLSTLLKILPRYALYASRYEIRCMLNYNPIKI